MQFLCRDCIRIGEVFPTPKRCPNCGSPRIIAHEELTGLTIAHIDCDAFYANIEKRNNPQLKDRPVIIGMGVRSVVATCCYIARQSGVHSAMPSSTAKKLCPNGVFLKTNMKEYKKVSREIFALFEQLTPLIEPLSIDEAFLDLGGTQKLHKAPPALVLAKLAQKIEQQIGISISIGLSHNKFLAKIASDMDKPRGFSIIGKQETLSFLANKPVNIIYGVGKKFTQKLKQDGFLTLAQLQNHPKEDLIKRYGELGANLAQLSRGIDNRKVKPNIKAKSLSTEITFEKDIDDFEILSTKLYELSEKLSQALKKKRLIGDIITLKLKTKSFKLRTRSKQIVLPTQLAHIIFEIAQYLLLREVDGTKFRLIGVGISGLRPGRGQDPIDLIEPKIAKKTAAERAIDNLREKYGENAVISGKLYPLKNKSDTKNKGGKTNERINKRG